ncbi:hypothetical protein [Arthrobacter sp. B0490]|uniref:hypothetical protein n=1 Tax=Arthrobacter sp. B0490 TaxID=2058891 RepID=UPI000CE5391F|nr:hypothetical protein [Arthrobacter sp. B0490]
MRQPPYAGPDDAGDFDGLTPDEAAKLLNSYRLLGDCFELHSDEDLARRGWLLSDWKTLLENRQEQLQRADRELAAAVRLARNEGASWHDIARILRLPIAEARAHFDWPHGGF